MRLYVFFLYMLFNFFISIRYETQTHNYYIYLDGSSSENHQENITPMKHEFNLHIKN